MHMHEAIQGYTIANKGSYNLSDTTLGLYLHWLGMLCDHLGNPIVNDITPNDLTNFMVHMRTEYKPQRKSGDTSPLSPSSIRIIYLSIRSFFSWASTTINIPRPDDHLKPPRFKYPQVQPFSSKEILSLVSASKFIKTTPSEKRKSYVMKRPTALRDTAIVMTLLDTGARASECCRLNIGDVNLDNGEVAIRPYGTGNKTKPRTVFLGAKAREATWKYIVSRAPYQSDHPLFITKNRRRFDRSALRHLIVRMGERAGIHGATTHRFRHTFAIEFIRNGGDIFTLKRMLGHATLDMVQNYLALANTDVQEAHRKASPVDRIVF